MNRSLFYLITIVSLSIIILIGGCAEPIEIGEKTEDLQKIRISEINLDPSECAGDTIKTRGVIIDNGVDYRLVDDGEYLILALVGFDLPDSLIGAKVHCEGMIFYHEEKGHPSIASTYIAGRPCR